MISVCLAIFSDGPWSKGLSDQIDTALKSSKKHTFKIDKTRGLPKKKYDIIFLCGIRILYKMKIDINYLRNFAQLVIEFGDTEQDPRDAGADLYFFFTPTDIGIEGRKLLPKFVNENELYSEQDEKITIYVDHYGHQTTSEQELSRAAMKNVFYQLSLFDFEFDFFFHSQNGVEKNPKNIALPSDQKHDYKKLDFVEIAKYYRKSHIFFPTHRETQGMLAHEIGLCGGITIMQQWMFPSPFHKQFRHLLYDFENPVDLKKLKIILGEKDFLKKNRDHVMRFISKEKFIETFLLQINTLIEKKLH